MKKLLFTLALLVSFGCFAQQKEIRGTILSVDGDPLSKVEVQVGFNGTKVFSDENGNYKIIVPTGVDEMGNAYRLCFNYESNEKKRYFRIRKSFYVCVDVLSNDKIMNIQNTGIDRFNEVKITRPEMITAKAEKNISPNQKEIQIIRNSEDNESNDPSIILDESLRIDYDKTIDYLNFLNNAMKGISVAEAVTEAKRMANHESAIKYGMDGYSKLLENTTTNTKYIGKTNGQYLYVIENQRPNNYLGYFIEGGNPVILIYIFSNDKDFYKKNTITKVQTRLLFQRKTDNNINLNQIQDNFETTLDNFYLNKCTTGLVNPKIGNQISSGRNTVDVMKSFDIIHSDMLEEGTFQNKEDCISDCESCMLNVTFGLATSGAEINEGWSKALHITIEDKLLSALANVTKDVESVLNYEVNDPNKNGATIDLRDINTFDLQAMIKFFLEDFKQRGGNPSNNKINASFESLEGSVIALAYGMNNDSNIIIKVDPENWRNSSKQKKWYILYHELGHDVLNFKHGNGGKMMFNFADREYSWDEFVKDKKYMFDAYFDN